MCPMQYEKYYLNFSYVEITKKKKKNREKRTIYMIHIARDYRAIN